MELILHFILMKTIQSHVPILSEDTDGRIWYSNFRGQLFIENDSIHVGVKSVQIKILFQSILQIIPMFIT
ncbi:MAG: hypothetical protein R2799_06780 [Crocinitomicaceae bacterium]